MPTRNQIATALGAVAALPSPATKSRRRILDPSKLRVAYHNRGEGNGPSNHRPWGRSPMADPEDGPEKVGLLG
jgi:hypothetical protein